MLKAILLGKKLREKRAALEALIAKDAEFSTREAELAKAIEEVTEETSAEDRSAIEEEVNQFEAEKAAHEDEKKELERVIGELETDLAAEEAAQNTEPAPTVEQEERKERKSMKIIRKVLRNMTVAERNDLVAREDVRQFLAEVRSGIKEKRAINNVGLLIPEVLLGLLRQNIEGYSKLYKHVNVQSVSGEGRLIVEGAIPEAIWTECCANLNELALGFNDVAVDCFKVGGYFKICNANIEDSDIDLVGEVLDKIGQAIGLALDKAILYGRNTSAHLRMPEGVMTRLVQTSEPAGYPATSRPWVDLHTSNIKTISNLNTGATLFQQILLASGAAKGKYARGEKVWCMNETTLTYLQSEGLSINAAGMIVSAMGNTMPVVGGVVETLEFIPNYVIIGGYFELYLLAERKGKQFATSEHVYFLQDQTVMKGTARYDGVPVIAEAFVAIGVNGVTPDSAMDFAPDEANTVQSIALNTSTAAVTAATGSQHSVQLFAITAPGAGSVAWTSSSTGKATVDDNGVVTGVASGSATITATSNGKTASCVITVT